MPCDACRWVIGSSPHSLTKALHDAGSRSILQTNHESGLFEKGEILLIRHWGLVDVEAIRDNRRCPCTSGKKLASGDMQHAVNLGRRIGAAASMPPGPNARL
jgi:hypothetical protein